MFGNNEYRIGAFSGLVACILVLALTAMAFVALEPPREHATHWDVSSSQSSPSLASGFGS
jgi:hypothetical protein